MRIEIVCKESEKETLLNSLMCIEKDLHLDECNKYGLSEYKIVFHIDVVHFEKKVQQIN